MALSKLTFRRMVLLIASLAAVLAVALSFSLGSGHASPSPLPIGDGSVRALDQNSTAPETLPAEVRDMHSRSWLAAPSSGQRIRSSDAHSLWVASGSDGLICLVDKESATGSVLLACGMRSTLVQRGALYVAHQVNEGDPISVVGLVDDGVSGVVANGQEVPVRDNAFELNGVDPSADSISLQLNTSNGPHTLDIANPHP
jgi:hypothetical protein